MFIIFPFTYSQFYPNYLCPLFCFSIGIEMSALMVSCNSYMMQFCLVYVLCKVIVQYIR